MLNASPDRNKAPISYDNTSIVQACGEWGAWLTKYSHVWHLLGHPTGLPSVGASRKMSYVMLWNFLWDYLWDAS